MLALSIAALAFQGPAPLSARAGRASLATMGPSSLAEVKADSGVSAPLGFWDPAGIMEVESQVAQYAFFKEVEIKHSRVAMLAAPGFLIGERFHPLFGGFVDAPSYLAFQQTPLQKFWPLVVLAIGAFEFATSVPTFEDPEVAKWAIKKDHIPGNLGFFKGAELYAKDPAAFKEEQTKELNNGRLAMIAIAGMVAQELATGGKLFS